MHRISGIHMKSWQMVNMLSRQFCTYRLNNKWTDEAIFGLRQSESTLANQYFLTLCCMGVFLKKKRHGHTHTHTLTHLETTSLINIAQSKAIQ